MSLPPFSAEASLGATRGTYRSTPSNGRSGTGDVLPMQAFAGSSAIGHTWPVIRCCRWVPAFGRFVCTSRPHRPWESCRCVSGVFGPIILCQDIEITQG